MKTRATLIKLVHAGARNAFADDAARRTWQRERTGKDSCKDMTDGQLEALVGELRRKGALHDGPPRRAGRVPFNPSPYMAKIEAMLAEMGLSWQYAEAIAWRITGGRGLRPGGQPGQQRLEWVRGQKHFEGIIAALEVEQTKRRMMRHITTMLAELGLDITAVDEWVAPQLRGPKWQRNLKVLKAVYEHLDDLIAARQVEGEV